ncbi:hypothetical protein BDQ12DRAFT_726691 [Crucibulum laeve]|uniref:Uncharacterized protein n=1 Tax=Crucibulum laeve TaxID=68775 RepID=A0A5C3LRK0_9AGAR|nr:hypothetical protein BDQ12DRAFT_726691 [Crucibulum laeve]
MEETFRQPPPPIYLNIGVQADPGLEQLQHYNMRKSSVQTADEIPASMPMIHVIGEEPLANVAPTASLAPQVFRWSDEELPTPTIHTVRHNLSILRSHSTHPFGTLQRQNR